jgi:Protein of unknown function (DUF2809)
MIEAKGRKVKIRVAYFFIVVITVMLGLSSRRFGYLLPEFIAVNAGDVFWAMMVYFGFRFLFWNKSYLVVLALSIVFCFGIEISQLYQADWINQIRQNRIFGLMLGKGFLYADLVRYTFGLILALIIDFLGIKLILKGFNIPKH